MNSAYPSDQFHLPKIYIKQYYSVSCAIHARIVRVRSQTRGDRNIRYTTKVRRTKLDENRTGGFAVVAPQLAKMLNKRPQGPRKPVDKKPAAEAEQKPAATEAPATTAQ